MYFDVRRKPARIRFCVVFRAFHVSNRVRESTSTIITLCGKLFRLHIPPVKRHVRRSMCKLYIVIVLTELAYSGLSSELSK